LYHLSLGLLRLLSFGGATRFACFARLKLRTLARTRHFDFLLLGLDACFGLGGRRLFRLQSFAGGFKCPLFGVGALTLDARHFGSFTRIKQCRLRRFALQLNRCPCLGKRMSFCCGFRFARLSHFPPRLLACADGFGQITLGLRQRLGFGKGRLFRSDFLLRGK
jgi:hypothetical protein